MNYSGYTVDPNVVDRLKQQITNQRNNVTFADGKTLGDYWTGGAGTDWATTEMAQMLAASGITSIDQVGLIKKAVPQNGIVVTPIYQNPGGTKIVGYQYSGGDSGNYEPIYEYVSPSGPIVKYTAQLSSPSYDEQGNQTYPGEYIELTPEEISTIPSWQLAQLQAGQMPRGGVSFTQYIDAVGNKNTGQPLIAFDHARGGINADTWGSTTYGKDNTYYKVSFDQNTGLPLFYTAPKEKGDAFSQFTSMLKQAAPALSIAMMAVPGVGQALGSTLLGAVGATELAANSAIAAAVGNAVVTTVLTGSPKAGINSAIGSYVGQGIASQLGDLATSAAGKQLVESMSSAATRSLITGRNSGEILQDTIAAGIGSAGRLLLESSPWGSTSGLSNETKAALSTAVSTALQGEGNLSEKLAKAAQDGAITYGISQINTGGMALTPSTQNVLNKTLGAALSGKPITAALVSAAISNANNELSGVLKKQSQLETELGVTQARSIIDTAMAKAGPTATPFDYVNTYLDDAIAKAQVSTPAKVSTALVSSGLTKEAADKIAPDLVNNPEKVQAAIKDPEQFVPLVTTPAEDVDGTKVGTLPAEAKEYSDKLYEELKKAWPDAQDKQIKSVAEVASSDLYDWYHSMGRPVDVDDPTQFARGMAMANGMLGISDNMIGLQKNAAAIAHANKNLERFNLIDQGNVGDVLKEPGISDYTRFKINQYIAGDEATRQGIRDEEIGAIKLENNALRANMREVFEFYREAQQYKPIVKEFTNIRTDNLENVEGWRALAEDFGDWLAYNMGSGLVQFAPILAAGLTTGGTGVLAVGTTFGIQEAIGERIQALSKSTPNWSSLSEDQKADLIIDKLQESGGTNVLVGMGVGALDRVLGPSASAIKNSLFRAAAKDVVSSGAVSALKDMPKEAAEEFVAGNLQQLAQILGSRHLGEQTGDLLSVENLKAMFNAGMAEAAGSIAGGGANMFVSGGLQQFGTAAVTAAANKVSDQIASQGLPQTELIRDPIVHVDMTGNRYLDTGDGFVIVENPAGEVSLLDANSGQSIALSNEDKLALINRYVQPSENIAPVGAPQAASQILGGIDDRMVNEAEVRQMFADIGYQPTDDEVRQYTQSRYDANNAPSADLVGAPRGQADIKTDVTTYADPKVVDISEAKAALEAAGLKNPTAEEVNKLVGQYPESDLSNKTKDMADTLQIERLAKDVADVQAKIGAPNTLPTADDALLAQRIAVGLVPGVGRTSDSPGFDKNYDVNGDGRITSADALKLLKMSQGVDVGPLPDGLKWEAPTGLYKRMFDVEMAVKNIQFPDTLSEEDVRNIVDDAFEKNPSLTETDVTRVVNDALTKLPAAPTKQDVIDAVNDSIGTRSVQDDPATPQDESKEATGLYRDLERLEFALNNIEFPPSLTEEQVRKIVQDAFDANPGLSNADVTNAIDAALSKLPAAPTLEEINTAVSGQIGARSVKDDPSTPQDESKEATGIYREIERIEQAIAGIEIPPTLTEQQVKEIVAGVFKENPGLSTNDVKDIVNTALEGLPDAPTLAEISQEVDSIVGAPSIKDDPATPENEAREATGVYRAIEATAAGVESRLGAAIADAKAAGLEGDAALDAAIKKVALQLGTSETTLLAKIGKTAEDLSRDFAAQLETVTGQITTVEQAIGKPASVDANGNPVAATGLYAEIAKHEAAGMTREAATQKAIADLSKQLGASETAIKNALAVTESTLGGRITTVEQAIGAPESVDSNGNKIPATGIYAEIAKNEAAGMTRDAATQKAIADLSTQLGASETAVKAALTATETALGGRIATVEQAIGAPASVGADGKPIAATGIFAEIAKNEAAGMSRDAATQKAITDLSAQLGVAQDTILGELSKAEARFGTALAGAQTALTGQITAAQNQIMERMAVYEQAGIDRDTALNLAIQDVSSKLGGQITGLEQLVGKPSTVATQTDIDAINQMLSGAKPMDLKYDVTGDRVVDEKDITALRDWMSGTTPLQPPPDSPWAPTGLYGELAKATEAQQAAAKAQTEQVLRGQRQANVMQMLGLIAQEPAGGAQQVTVKAADPAKIGYIYDWSSIFANPQQQQMFASPFAEGGEVADTDELIAILRGSHG